MIDTLFKKIGTYNIFARFLPSFLYVCYFDMLNEKIISRTIANFLDIHILIILAIVAIPFALISAMISSLIQQFIWRKLGNPIIKTFKKTDLKLFKKLKNKYHEDYKIISHILSVTRQDEKLLMKNIFHGFFRNSIILSLLVTAIMCLINYDYFLYANIFIFCFNLIFSFLSAVYYRKQLFNSYMELHNNG